jgi:hypothetical protein
MFIVRSRLWGPIAGVATALLFVWILGTDSERANPGDAAPASQIAAMAR